MFIDLTHEFRGGMPTYPEDPVPTLSERATLERDGYVDHLLTTGMHVGTHIDAPAHMIHGGKRIHEYGPEAFFCSATIIDVRGQKTIDADTLSSIKILPHSAVLLFTGHASQFHANTYFTDHPLITESCAQALIDAGVSMLGIDSPSPDSPPFAVHKLLLSHNILILENLTNLDRLLGAKTIELIALPLFINTDAAPVRAVARIP
jgi:kynurenine formamidase